MEATSVLVLETANVNIPKIKVKWPKTATRLLVSNHTLLPVEIALSDETDYSDEQFYADLRKASKQLDLMESKALEEYAQGKTRKFPM